MAIKDIIARGIGFSPGSVGFIVTHGFAIGAAAVGDAPGYDLSAANDTAASDRVARPVTFAALEFASETLRVCDLPFDLAWGGHTWRGVGELGSVEPVEEGVELQATRLRLVLNGVELALLSIALGEDYQGRAATLYLGFLDSGHRLVDTPDTLFAGRMDTMTITAGGTASIALTVESRLADWERARVRRYNNADQQQRWPGDTGLLSVEEMANKEILWPNAGFVP